MELSSSGWLLLALISVGLSIAVLIGFFNGVKYLKEIALNTRSLQIMVEKELGRGDRQPTETPGVAHADH